MLVLIDASTFNTSESLKVCTVLHFYGVVAECFKKKIVCQRQHERTLFSIGCAAVAAAAPRDEKGCVSSIFPPMKPHDDKILTPLYFRSKNNYLCLDPIVSLPSFERAQGARDRPESMWSLAWEDNPQICQGCGRANIGVRNFPSHPWMDRRTPPSNWHRPVKD